MKAIYDNMPVDAYYGSVVVGHPPSIEHWSSKVFGYRIKCVQVLPPGRAAFYLDNRVGKVEPYIEEGWDLRLLRRTLSIPVDTPETFTADPAAVEAVPQPPSNEVTNLLNYARAQAEVERQRDEIARLRDELALSMQQRDQALADLNRARSGGFTERQHKVFTAIAAERERQDKQWGALDWKKQTVEGFLLVLRAQLDKAYDAWIRANMPNETLRRVRNVAAVAVACLEQHRYD